MRSLRTTTYSSLRALELCCLSGSEPAPVANSMHPAVNSPVRWQERVREPSLTALLAYLLLLTFVVTPLGPARRRRRSSWRTCAI
jgi:hypothetical protein